MPYTANSLGQWMKRRDVSRDLSFTVGDSPVRPAVGAPRGALCRLKSGSYHTRYGWKRLVTTVPDPSPEPYIITALVADRTALFAFHPHWAKRLPLLQEEPDIVDKLAALSPGDNPLPTVPSSGLSASLAALYAATNADVDYWFSRSTATWYDSAVVWASYAVTNELVERPDAILWRKLYSPWVQAYKESGSMPFDDFPEERKETMRNFPTEVYVRENHLRVLGHSADELGRIYSFHIFDPTSRHVVVLDHRCNLVVASLGSMVR